MLDFAAKERIFFSNQAVFTKEICAGGDLLPNLRANVSTH